MGVVMTSKSTQIWTTLRHLALVCVVVVGVLSILATGGGGGSSSAPLTPPPPLLSTVAFQAATSATADEAAGNHAINVVLSVPVGSTPTAITVDVTDALSGTATSGTDYTAVGTVTLTFPAGSVNGAIQTFNLAVLADALVEGNETVDLQLGNVTGAALGVQTTHEATITDDDPPNTAPVASAACDNTLLNTLLNGDLKSSVFDPDSPVLNFTLVMQGVKGVATVDVTGAFTYSPFFNERGTDSFTYEVDDLSGGTDTGVVTVIIGDTRIMPLGDSITTGTGELTTGPLVKCP